MLRILFTADDFALTRFLPEPDPLLEMKFAARGLRRGIRAPWGERWRCAALGAVPISAGPMRELTAHFSWSLTPNAVLTADLDESIDMHMRLTPKRARAEMALWLSRAAIFALPARYEPFGLSALEAGLAACALVLGDIPSLREVWHDTAIFAPPEQPEALAAALLGLIAEAPRRRQWARRAQVRAQQFTPERMAQEYVMLYHQLIGTPV